MSEFITAARPYARAAFELARDKKTLPKWSKELAFMAKVAEDPSMQAVLDSPRLTRTERADLFLKVCKDKLHKHAENLVRLLAENGRLVMLPAIADQFEVYRIEAENQIEATVISAHAISNAENKKIVAALEKRFGRKISLSTVVDENLIGGAVIKAGDKVIDGSLKANMNKMATALLS